MIFIEIIYKLIMNESEVIFTNFILLPLGICLGKCWFYFIKLTFSEPWLNNQVFWSFSLSCRWSDNPFYFLSYISSVIREFIKELVSRETRLVTYIRSSKVVRYTSSWENTLNFCPLCFSKVTHVICGLPNIDPAEVNWVIKIVILEKEEG